MKTTQARPGLLSRERTIARPGFNRWLVAPAALAIHLCIGMIYGFSVFWLPLQRAVGVTQPKPCGAELGWLQTLFATDCDWENKSLAWTFSLAIVFLGSSAAVFGHWLEKAGPRKAGLVAACCWCGGLAISALGVYLHQIILLWLGAGVIGGIGLGLGYISPVSTLIKWFPDRRGLATGLAIMGFGGGAMIGAPLADRLMKYFASPTSVGVWQTFATLAVIYFIFMLGGSFGYRVPPEGWTPKGWTPPALSQNRMIAQGHVHLSQAWKTPQFWLLWLVLLLNVSAGIGVLYIASPMLQEVFGGQLIGANIGFDELNAAQKAQIATVAAGFTGLLSLCNIFGRIGWASLSDWLGRKLTYAIFFALGMTLYALAPSAARSGSVAAFVLCMALVLTMYGGGFATIPAYLADMFGTKMVGAIHGRLLTAWSVAGIVGPNIVNYFHDSQLHMGVARSVVYDETMYMLAALLALGFLCNLLIRPVAAHHFMSEGGSADAAGAATTAGSGESEASAATLAAAPVGENRGSVAALLISWMLVGAPLAWGISVTLQKTAALFR